MHDDVMFVSKCFIIKTKRYNLAALFNLICYMYTISFDIVKVVATQFSLISLNREKGRYDLFNMQIEETRFQLKCDLAYSECHCLCKFHFKFNHSITFGNDRMN